MYCTWGFQKGDRKGRYIFRNNAWHRKILRVQSYTEVHHAPASLIIYIHTLHTSTRKGREGKGWDGIYSILIMQLAARSIARSPM